MHQHFFAGPHGVRAIRTQKHRRMAGRRAAAALSNRTGRLFFFGLLRKTHTQVIEYPHIGLPLTSLILIFF
jgi:hypothetical protein